ncbi:long-chain fatty acid--CoA ligase [Geothermobacter hydrogeniphilus]|uniref:Long-chain fatty acid--CoA ligase n=1 Tax=Geothermobacter hydrogeniphilus TaxID=1969733 RepID=A0A2K2H8P6_9BACT|nr:long-chain fatty acid--CoA ligase [Geothermobacter hydrogeniphilus]PNU19603.1 long-chain fatty acid--CoA ligase [Geothermobacter hydrogeniphilus]
MKTEPLNLPFPSVPAMLRDCGERFRDRDALSYKKDGQWKSLSYGQFYQRVLMAARGLGKLGVEPGEKVAILSENRAGWIIADLGILCARAVTVPIYATNTAAQVSYVLQHSGARIVFVSNRLQYDKLLAVRDQLPELETVIAFERFIGDKSLPVFHLYQLSEISHPISVAEQQQIETQMAEIGPDDLLTLIYTSGTTGVPKGVMLTHANFLIDARIGLDRLGGRNSRETFLSFLPLSHVLERTAGYYAALMSGSRIAFAESVDKVVENIVEVQPTAMVSVPRLFEKIYSRIYENVHLMSPPKRKLFHKAVEVGRQYVYRRYIERKPTGLLGAKYRFYDRLIFAKIRQKFGGQLKFFISGGAPLDKTINEFLWIIGIPAFEGYGLTETSPAITLSSLEQNRFGSVGRPLEHTEVKLAEDGELLVRGPQVMRGYYRNEKATSEAMEDGWFKTGDIARIDEDGYVYIVDRKKEIIVTAGGKNIAPQPLENELKLDKYISQAYVYGDRKPYLVALITPNLERLIELGHEKNLDYFDIEELVANEKVRAVFAERIEQFNGKLPSYETIKKFVLLPRDFSVEGGELTPTLKLKRKVIYEKYRERIESLYDQNGTTANQNHQGETA